VRSRQRFVIVLPAAMVEHFPAIDENVQFYTRLQASSPISSAG
jgi:hypothetical protein